MSSRLRYLIPSALSLLALAVAVSSGTFAGAQGLPDAGSIPPGTVAAFAGTNPPPGWLPTDGSAVPRTQYPGLYAAIGTRYGAGDGSTTFNLPDLRGRVLAGQGTASDVDTLGENDGLAVGSRKIHHRHGKGTINIPNGGAHSHQPAAGYFGDFNNAFGGPGLTTSGGSFQLNALHGGTASATHSHPNSEFAGEVGDTSGPPDAPAYQVVVWMIKG